MFLAGFAFGFAVCFLLHCFIRAVENVSRELLSVEDNYGVDLE